MSQYDSYWPEINLSTCEPFYFKVTTYLLKQCRESTVIRTSFLDPDTSPVVKMKEEKFNAFIYGQGRCEKRYTERWKVTKKN